MNKRAFPALVWLALLGSGAALLIGAFVHFDTASPPHLTASAQSGPVPQPLVRYITQPISNSIKVETASSQQEWDMEGSVIGGFLELGQGVSFDKTQAAPAGLQGDKVPAKCNALIPVNIIHSKAEHMPNTEDNLMQKALKASDFGLVRFTLDDLTFKGSHEAGQPFNLDAKGELTIAGKTNAARFPVTIDPVDDSTIRITGSTIVKTTDYGVEPPAPEFGVDMLKAGPNVSIKFDWTLVRKQ